MTIEKIEILVEAKLEPTMKDVKKLMNTVRQQVSQAAKVAEKTLKQIDMKDIRNKLKKQVQLVRKEIASLKKASQSSEIKIKINNKEALKQIEQIEKKINSLKKKISASKIEENLNVIKNKNAKTINGNQTNSKQYTISGIKDVGLYNKEFKGSNLNSLPIKQEAQQMGSSPNKLNSFFDMFKGKMQQANEVVGEIRNTFGKISNVTKPIANGIRKIGTSIKSGIGHVIKFATYIFSLKNIYSILKVCAQSWLSSQNSEAQQLSANIEYMKYAMGGVFAPVIEYVINLVYKLMKAIQSVAYAFSGINIFAKATASSMNKTSGSAKQASKSLMGIHGEINNTSGDSNSGSENSVVTPNIDLSKIDDKSNNIINAVKGGDWNEIGMIIGQKLNNSVNSIDWNFIASVISNFISLIIDTLYGIITEFDWIELGYHIGNSINILLTSIDWGKAGQTLFESISGILSTIITYLATLDWFKIGSAVGEFLANIDWLTIFGELSMIICEAVLGLILMVAGFLWEILKGVGKWLYENLVETSIEIFNQLWEGIREIFSGVGEWFADRFKEAVEGIKENFSTVKEFFIAVWQGICSAFGRVPDWFKEKFSQAWEAVKNVFSSGGKVFEGIKEGILNGLKVVVNAIIRGINRVISIPFNGINSALRNIRGVNIMGFQPFTWIREIGIPQIPELAKGNVAYSPMIAQFGEYAGASTNPEITTPQNIMRETFDEVLLKHEWNGNNNTKSIQLAVYVGNKKLGEILLDDLRDMRRRSGKGIEALVN